MVFLFNYLCSAMLRRASYAQKAFVVHSANRPKLRILTRETCSLSKQMGEIIEREKTI